jgi:hypothetical protein
MADTDDHLNNQLDDEMKALLQKLDEPDPIQKMEADAPAIEAAVPTADPSPEPTATPISEIAMELDYRDVPPDGAAVAEIVPPPPPLAAFDAKAEFDHCNAISDEMVQCARADRQEAQDAITLVRGQIDKIIQASNGGAPKIDRGLLDNLTLLLEVKKDVTMVFAKALESRVKLIAALKVAQQVNIQNNGGSGTQIAGMVDQELVKALSLPLDTDGDDEY